MAYILSMQGRRIIFRLTTTPLRVLNAGNKRAVTEFNYRTASRVRRYLSTCRAGYRLLGTLTYPEDYPVDGREVKIHLHRFIKRLRRKTQSTIRIDEEQSWSIFWFLEFQKRGAPHFHFFLTHPPIPDTDGQGKTSLVRSREWIANAWYECVGSFDTRHREAGTQLDYLKSGRGGSISYAQKYARKQSQKKVPDEFINVGRFWGVSGDRSTVSADIVLTDKHLKVRNILELAKWFKKEIEYIEKQGIITVHRDSHGRIKWVYCKTDDAQRRMWVKMNIFQCKVATEYTLETFDWSPYDILDDPELNEIHRKWLKDNGA